MKLAILLTAAPESPDVESVHWLLRAARRRGHQVNLFLMDDGVANAPSFQHVIDDGVNVVVCAHNAEQRGVKPVPGCTWGGQYQWAMMVAESDRVLSFG
jgi:sulfur relay (sulfurtransferase) complex TusBCD TusD component (DsrE family)